MSFVSQTLNIEVKRKQRENKAHCFPRCQSLSVLLYLPTPKLKKKCKKKNKKKMIWLMHLHTVAAFAGRVAVKTELLYQNDAIVILFLRS